MLLTGAAIRPASALTTVNPTPNLTLTGTPALIGVTYALVHNGDLWVSDYGANLVNEYAAPFTANEAPTLSVTVGRPAQLAFDTAGNLWVGSYTNGAYEFDSPITNGMSPSVTLTGFDEATGVVLHQGNLWVFDWEAGNVYEFSPEPTTFVATPAPVLSAGTPIEGVFDSSNNLWIANYAASGNEVTEYSSPIHLGESPSNTLSLTSPDVATTIAMDGAGNLWVGTEGTGLVDEFTAPISIGESGVAKITVSSFDSIWGVSVDSMGNIWVGDYVDNLVYEFSGLAQGSSPSSPPSPLPPVIPTTLTFAFSSFSGTAPAPIVGKLVGVEGAGILYNLPGYQQAGGVSPYAYSFCSIASQGLIQVSGFSDYQAGFNSSEIFVSNYASFVSNAQGWPTEPACTS